MPLIKAAEPAATVTLDGVASSNPMLTHSVNSLVPAVASEFDHFRQPNFSVSPILPAEPVGPALSF